MIAASSAGTQRNLAHAKMAAREDMVASET